MQTPDEVKRSRGLRLKQVRQHFNLTQEEFAVLVGLTQGGYSDVERGKANISRTLSSSLKNGFNVNPDFLYFGKGNMFINNEEKKPMDYPNQKKPFDQVDENGLAFNIINRLIDENAKLRAEIISIREGIPSS